MIFTEARAREKICPLSFAVPEVRSPNGDGFCEHGPWLCQASKCMAWRWADDPVKADDRRGYCGNFGQPRFDR